MTYLEKILANIWEQCQLRNLTTTQYDAFLLYLEAFYGQTLSTMTDKQLMRLQSNLSASFDAFLSGGTTPTPNQAPVVSFTHSFADLQGTFTGTATDPDGSIVSWAWAFGDGLTSNVQNPTHTYAASGNYTVTLTARDNLGISTSYQQTVTVTDSTGPTTPPDTKNLLDLLESELPPFDPNNTYVIGTPSFELALPVFVDRTKASWLIERLYVLHGTTPIWVGIGWRGIYMIWKDASLDISLVGNAKSYFERKAGL